MCQSAVRPHSIVVLARASQFHLQSTIIAVSLYAPSFVTISSSKPTGVGRVNRGTRNSAQRIENNYYDSLAFSRHNIDLVFDEKTMEPERLTEAPENASIDPSTMRVS